MDKSGQQQPETQPRWVTSYAQQRRDEFQKVQADYLRSRDPGDFWPGDIVLVDSQCEVVGHYPALVCGRYSSRLGTYYMVEEVGAVADGRGIGEVINGTEITAPILLVSREGRHG